MSRSKTGRCISGKRKFLTYVGAMEAASTRDVALPSAYRCTHCNRYHITKGKKINSEVG